MHRNPLRCLHNIASRLQCFSNIGNADEYSCGYHTEKKAKIIYFPATSTCNNNVLYDITFLIVHVVAASDPPHHNGGWQLGVL